MLRTKLPVQTKRDWAIDVLLAADNKPALWTFFIDECVARMAFVDADFAAIGTALFFTSAVRCDEREVNPLGSSFGSARGGAVARSFLDKLVLLGAEATRLALLHSSGKL